MASLRPIFVGENGHLLLGAMGLPPPLETDPTRGVVGLVVGEIVPPVEWRSQGTLRIC
jgi:hypothetical protein